MSKDLFQAFDRPSKAEWLAVLTRELKGKDFDSNFVKNDPIEALTYPSFFHRSDSQTKPEAPGSFPYKRGNTVELNDWDIVSELKVQDVAEANKLALDLLMKGTTALVFDIRDSGEIAYERLLQGIELEYIKLYVRIATEEQFDHCVKQMASIKYSELICLWNPLSLGKQVSGTFKQQNGQLTRYYDVDAYSIQQTGANAAQELAFALSLGHQYLYELIKQGALIDDALCSLHFTLGIGSNYLLETAKFRAFRVLWSKLARAYAPEHSCSEVASVTAKTGFVNKSLLDPHTNILRQTTEAMSAVLGGVNQIQVQAYDAQAAGGATTLATRMATNISLILKEESYFNQVIDAVGGSYAIEELTSLLAEKAWGLFQGMEAAGGVTSEAWREDVQETANIRKKMMQKGERILIGINRYKTPNEAVQTWKKNEAKYFGLNQLILEEELVESVSTNAKQ